MATTASDHDGHTVTVGVPDGTVEVRADGTVWAWSGAWEWVKPLTRPDVVTLRRQYVGRFVTAGRPAGIGADVVHGFVAGFEQGMRGRVVMHLDGQEDWDLTPDAALAEDPVRRRTLLVVAREEGRREGLAEASAQLRERAARLEQNAAEEAAAGAAQIADRMVHLAQQLTREADEIDGVAPKVTRTTLSGVITQRGRVATGS